MTGKQFRAIRKKLGFSALRFGRALGYEKGLASTVRAQISRLDSGDREIPPCIGRLATMFSRHGIPKDFLE
ncbi:MAG: hypothetical protein ACRECF_05410 [Methyloceanibacter sp.]